MKFNLVELIHKSILSFETERGVANFWKPPLVGVLSAEDPMISELKYAVSPDHLLPKELLPDAKSIIVFFIPFENRIAESNLNGEYASEEWAQAYVFTNELIAFINDDIEKHLNCHGFKTAKIMATHNFDEKTLMSRWSHRHIARIAGLGSFGLNNMLITSAGCCGRLGSIVTNVEYREFVAIGKNIFPALEKCLHKINGSCGICLKKCQPGAIGTGRFFNRQECYKACLKNAEIHKSIGLADVCGKCLVGLPCSNMDPSE
jgi:epoxyqueuosine reductase QueG